MVEQELHAEVIHRAAEEDRRHFSSADIVELERGAGAFEQLDLIAELRVNIRRHRFAHDGVIDARDFHRRAVRPPPVRSKR
jgi:hypothetical protein